MGHVKGGVQGPEGKMLQGTFFLKNSVWTPELRPGTQKIGFLVKNYPYSVILKTLGPNSGSTTYEKIQHVPCQSGVHKLQIFVREKHKAFSKNLGPTLGNSQFNNKAYEKLQNGPCQRWAHKLQICLR